MTKNDLKKEHLIELTKQTLNLRSTMTRDSISSLFTEMTLVEYVLLQHIWPQLETDTEADCDRVYLKDLSRTADLPIPKVSLMVQHLQDAGVVLWERDQGETYILPSIHGREVFHLQQETLLTYFDRVITTVGEDRYAEFLHTFEAFETILKEVSMS